MKTRMHRFWLSITLAAGSLASPWSAKLSAHDLPWRWASDTVSSSEWNYLRDDCLDSRGLSPYGNALSRSLKASRGSCPAEEAVADRLDAAAAQQSKASFASDIACWASKWELIQKKAGEAARATLLSHRQTVSKWAARPEFGVPPAPAVPIVDTCGYGAEYLAMQSAADLLDAEIARAATNSDREAQLNRALAAAAAIDAAAIDRLAPSELQPSESPSSALAEASSAQRSLCGGQFSEIVSQQRPHSDFAPPIDEYMAYDLDGRDAHWLGGLDKSWRLRAAISAAAAADAQAAAERSAAASFGADEFLEAPAVASSSDSFEIIEAPLADVAMNDVCSDSPDALCDFVSPIAPANPLRAARLVAAKPDAGVAPAPSRDLALKNRLADGLEWLEYATCVASAEMCGFDQAHHLGELWGDWSLAVAQHSMTTYVAMGHYLNLPPMVYEPTPDLEPRSDVYVVYTDGRGNQAVVPSTLTPAWNAVSSDATHSDAALDEASYLQDEVAAFESQSTGDAQWDAQATAGATAPKSGLTSSLDFARLRRQVLSLIARKLDAFGLSCLQTADHLSNWADMQIASRDDSDVR